MQLARRDNDKESPRRYTLFSVCQVDRARWIRDASPHVVDHLTPAAGQMWFSLCNDCGHFSYRKIRYKISKACIETRWRHCVPVVMAALLCQYSKQASRTGDEANTGVRGWSDVARGGDDGYKELLSSKLFVD
jgi:hypothetical protein